MQSIVSKNAAENDLQLLNNLGPRLGYRQILRHGCMNDVNFVCTANGSWMYISLWSKEFSYSPR